jgi:hypothetical protein
MQQQPNREHLSVLLSCGFPPALFLQARVLNIYPLALVPLFLGPPLGIFTRILSLRNLAVTRPTGPGTA